MSHDRPAFIILAVEIMTASPLHQLLFLMLLPWIKPCANNNHPFFPTLTVAFTERSPWCFGVLVPV